MPASPDVPALLNYIFVISFGTIVAIWTVNTLLSDQTNRWAFAGTWVLALSHVAIPPLLFWFLDYTQAAHDTSFFAALVVAFGYRQVFAGGIQGITLAGQTPALWKPFETWVQRVIEGIVARSKEYRDRFEDSSKRRISASAHAVQQLERVAVTYSNDPASLTTKIQAAQSRSAGAHRDSALTSILWDDLRQSQPRRYGELVRDAGLVSRLRVWWWFNNGRSKAVTCGILVVIAFGVYFMYPVGRRNQEPLTLQYAQWRFLKEHTTSRDRFRSLAYLEQALLQVDTHGAVTLLDGKVSQSEAIRRVIGSMLDELRFSDLSESAADRILTLVLRSGLAIRDGPTVRSLINAIWTESGAVRAKVNRALIEIQKVAYSQYPLSDGLATAPESGESFEAIDGRVRKWLEWWNTTSSPVTPKAPPIVVADILKKGKYVVEIPFAYKRDDLPSSFVDQLSVLAKVLKQNPGWRLRIDAHTDAVGSDAYNLALSKRRANSVYDFLTQQQGVPIGQLEIRAMGERAPRDTNETEEGRQRNRRVEFVRTDGEFSAMGD